MTPSSPSVLKSIQTLFLSSLSSLILSPVILIFALSLYMIRSLVSLYLQQRYKGTIKLISSMDSFQVYDKPNNILETYTLLVFQGDCDIGKIRNTVITQLLDKEDLYEKLKCRVTMKFGFYCWEKLGEDEFRVEDHIKVVPHLENMNNNQAEGIISNDSSFWDEDAVLKKISSFYSSGLPLSKPRWELWIIPNFKYDTNNDKNRIKHYALIFRAHHSIQDGISIYLMLTRALGGEGKGKQILSMAIDPLKPLPIPWHVKLVNYLKLLLLWPKMIKDGISAPLEKNCFHGPDLSPKKLVTWTNNFRIESLRRIRSNGKYGTNAILNAAVGGAFQALGKSKGFEIPENITAVTSIPMLPYPNLKPQNRFSGAFFSLPIAGDGGTEVGFGQRERIEKTNETLNEIINSPLILMNSWLLRFVGILPAKWSKNMTDSRELTVLTSNVPGPNGHAIYQGDKLVDVAGFLPIKNKTGFGFCFVSYCGNFRAGIVADANLASEQDLKILKEALETEIAEMDLASSSWKA